MRFVDRHLGEIERGRGRVAVLAIMADRPAYRGRSVEHLVRDGIDQLLPDERFGAAVVTGGFWTADHQTEVDLVAADRRAPPARRLSFIGTVTWCENKPLALADLNALIGVSTRVPGVTADTVKVGVSRSGIDARAAGAFDATRPRSADSPRSSTACPMRSTGAACVWAITTTRSSSRRSTAGGCRSTCCSRRRSPSS